MEAFAAAVAKARAATGEAAAALDRSAFASADVARFSRQAAKDAADSLDAARAPAERSGAAPPAQPPTAPTPAQSTAADSTSQSSGAARAASAEPADVNPQWEVGETARDYFARTVESRIRTKPTFEYVTRTLNAAKDGDPCWFQSALTLASMGVWQGSLQPTEAAAEESAAEKAIADCNMIGFRQCRTA